MLSEDRTICGPGRIASIIIIPIIRFRQKSRLSPHKYTKTHLLLNIILFLFFIDNANDFYIELHNIIHSVPLY